MEKYLIFKSIIMSILFFTAFAYFFIKVKRLYKIMMSVTGSAKVKPDRIKERIKAILIDVLGQSNVRKKLMPGLSHTMIFFGFLAIQPHSLELMIQGIIPFLKIALIFPKIYYVYLFSTDILAFFVLIGFTYALYRRLIIKPDYLTMGLDANLIILFTSIIVISFHFLNAFQSILPYDGFDYSNVFFISRFIADILDLKSFSIPSLILGYEICYYVHIITILSFLIYIPDSKHLHLLAAAPNIFFKELDIEKAIEKTDIENEEIETFGLGKVDELNWHNVLNLYACTECGRCEELCPAYLTSKPLSPKKILCDLKNDLLEQSDLILCNDDKKNNILPIIRENSPITNNVIWSCTTCRACENICPVSNEHLNFIFEMRKHQVLMQASFPAQLQEAFNNIENQFNPWGFSADTRADWCKGMDVSLMTDKLKTKILFFVGCAGSFDERGIKTSQAIVKVLKKADIDFAILGQEESCNGDMARRAGNEYLAQMMITQNIKVFSQYSFDTILTSCPHCYNIIKNEYPQFGAKYNVVTTAEYFDMLIKEGCLKIKPKNLGKLVLHDSCYLGQWNNIYDAPRDILKAINKENIVEMDRTRENAFCCGAGGARMFMEETIGERINNKRALQAAKSGANTIASACPFCATMINDGIAEQNEDIKIMDIATLVDQAT